jgi:hypothetical protein
MIATPRMLPAFVVDTGSDFSWDTPFDCNRAESNCIGAFAW